MGALSTLRSRAARIAFALGDFWLEVARVLEHDHARGETEPDIDVSSFEDPDEPIQGGAYGAVIGDESLSMIAGPPTSRSPVMAEPEPVLVGSKEARLAALRGSQR